MYIEKILLKNNDGLPVASATVYAGKKRTVKLPAGITLLGTASGIVLASVTQTTDGYLVDADGAPLSLLCKKGTEMLFGTEAQGKNASYIKWLLQGKADRDKKAREAEGQTKAQIPLKPQENNEAKQVVDAPQPQASPLPQGSLAEQEPFPPADEETPAVEIYESEEEEPSDERDEKEWDKTDENEPNEVPDVTLQKATELSEKMKSGEPFPLFEALIPNSEWALIKEDGYLIGRVQEDEEEIYLLGIPGRLGDAPDDNAEWSFIPCDEDAEEGYYVKKAF